MPVHLDPRKNVEDFSVRPEEISRSNDAHLPRAVQVLLLPHAVGFERSVGRVARQRKVQSQLFVEFSQVFRGICTDAQDRRPQTVELLLRVPILGRLAGSTRCAGSGEKVEDEIPASEICQVDFPARV